ncbi:hypothetical protein EYZ11_008592 [Aspergillus tanneri]|uniref:NAD-dependent epimerase/dehydratase domain-containing protein n=1 Tax=Aspergillus tanneri TaxID=1220188 RepID=A0A4S3JC79_9EURO|nr:hypothetical protein EYZ11_008592 [Aspergillus tanneri]
MLSSHYSIPPGALVLVTGANGYIASHVINLLLFSGYKVRGTIREPKPWLDDFFNAKHGQDKYESVVIPKLEDDGALNNCMEGICGVLHVASDMSYNPDPNVVIPNVVAATLNVLAAAARAPSVKRVVLTSSVLAALDGNDDEMVADVGK